MPALLSWAGSVPLQEVREHADLQQRVFGQDLVRLETAYALARQQDREGGSDAVFAVRRTMSVVLRRPGQRERTARVEIDSRARLNISMRPPDIASLVESPASYASNTGMMFADEVVESVSGRPHAAGRSLADMLRQDRLVAFETPLRERYDLLLQRIYRANTTDDLAQSVRRMEQNADKAIAALRAHTKKVESYKDGDWAAIERANDLLQQLAIERDLIRQNIDRGVYDSAQAGRQLERLNAIYRTLYDAYRDAESARAKEKSVGDHAKDIAKAPVNAVKSAAGGLVELGKMGLDGVRKIADEAVQLVSDYELDWEPYSAVGQAYASGKSTNDIALAALDGFVDQISEAIEHARNGDFSKLADFSAGVGLEVVLAAGTGGGTEVAAAAQRGARAAKDAAQGLASASKRTAKRMRQLAGEARALAKRSKEDWVARISTAIAETLDSLGPDVAAVAAGGGRAAIPSVEKATALLRTKQLGEVVGDTMKLGQRLERLATKLGRQATRDMKDVLEALARADKPTAYVKAVEKVIGMPGRIGADELMGLLKRSARVDAPAQFLDDVAWFAKRDLTPAARATVLRKVAEGVAPDLAWLRKSNLTDQRLEVLASNPHTKWQTFMKVSQRPSDMFPQALAERGLKKDAYAEAGRQLRGVAGEIVVGEMELPGGLKITKSQVPTKGGSILDYQVRDAAGREAWLEVKSWSKKQWQRQLDNLGGKGAEFIQGMFKELEDATASGKPTYLAVTNELRGTFVVKDLLKVLGATKLGHVKIIYFDEAMLGTVGRELRKAMAIGGTSTAAAMMADEGLRGEDDEPGSN